MCFPLQALPLVSWSRRLELQGELTELGCRRGGVLFTSRPRITSLCLLLFSDLLLITRPKRWVPDGSQTKMGLREGTCNGTIPCSTPSQLSSEHPLPWVAVNGYRCWTTPTAPWSKLNRFQIHLDPLPSASPFSVTTRAVLHTGYSKLHPCE